MFDNVYTEVEVSLGDAKHIPYEAAKASVIGLMRSLARTLGPEGIRINCIMPSDICTETELEPFPSHSEVSQLMNERQSPPDGMYAQHIVPAFAFCCF